LLFFFNVLLLMFSYRTIIKFKATCSVPLHFSRLDLLTLFTGFVGKVVALNQ